VESCDVPACEEAAASVTAMPLITPAVAMLPTRKTSLRLQMLRSAWSRFIGIFFSGLTWPCRVYRLQYNPLARKSRVALCLIGALVVLIGAPGAGAGKRVIEPAGVKPSGPYSQGILAGDFLHVSGQGGRGGDGKLPDTIEGMK
jgi:hypothetical protein